MDRDEAAFESFFILTDFEENVHYHDSLVFETGKGDLVIIDEADYFIYNDPDAFYKFQQNKKVLGFTATASNKNTNGLERMVFNSMNFKEATYWPTAIAKPFIDYSLGGIACEERE